jgi:Flp pilus assembly pilin Flp
MVDRITTYLVAAYLTLTADRAISLRRQEGQTMAEYALVLALIAAAAAATFTLLKGGITAKLQSVCDAIKGSTCT